MESQCPSTLPSSQSLSNLSLFTSLPSRGASTSKAPLTAPAVMGAPHGEHHLLMTGGYHLLVVVPFLPSFFISHFSSEVVGLFPMQCQWS